MMYVIRKKKKKPSAKTVQVPVMPDSNIQSPYANLRQKSASALKVKESFTKFDGKDYFGKMFQKNNYVMNGTLLLGAVGLGYALYKREHYFLYTFSAGALGAIVTTVLMSRYEFKKKQKQIED